MSQYTITTHTAPYNGNTAAKWVRVECLLTGGIAGVVIAKYESIEQAIEAAKQIINRKTG